MNWPKFYCKVLSEVSLRPRSAFTVFNTNVDSLVDATAWPLLRGEKFLDAIKEGKDCELPISASLAKRLSSLKSKKYQIGGQAGIAANALAALGISVACHVASPSPLQLRLLDKRVQTFSIVNGPTSTHYVLEFRKGQRFDGVRAGGTNRLIATFDPQNQNLELNRQFVKTIEARTGSYDFCIAGGFHLWNKRNIAKAIRLLGRWKKMNPRLFVYTELGNFSSPLAQFALSRLRKVADCIGMNEEELQLIGSESLPDNVVVHTADFAMAKVKQHSNHWKKALAFGCACAAASANGLSIATLKKMKSVPKTMQKFPSGWFGVPALRISPKSTVGLGDVFTAGLVAYLRGQR